MRTCTLAGLLVLCPGLARAAEDAAKPYPACDRTPTEGDVTAAKGAFQAGNGSFNEADYDRAINYWEDAYRRDCTAHPLLLNLARAYELNGLKHHAVTALQTFLDRNPGSADEDQIKRRVEKLEDQLKAEAAAAAPPPPTTTAPPPVAPAPAAAPPPEEPSSGKRPIAPLILAGGGGVVAIVGGVLWGTALSDVSKYGDQCPNRSNCPQAIADAGNSARGRATLGAVVTFVGVGAAAGGLIWYFVSQPEPQTASIGPRPLTARVSPSLGLGYGGVQLDGQF